MKLFKSTALTVALLSTLGSAYAQKQELTVYSAIETDQLKELEKAFNQDHPEIKLRIVRDSTGVVVSKLLAEKNNPKADVIWGVAITGLGALELEGMLEPYAPANIAKIDPKYKDKDAVPEWWGHQISGAVICFNTVEAEKRGLPKPTSWNDLLNPIYQGQIVMPDPTSSGTGYYDVVSWLQMWGDEQGKGGGWQYMDKLHNNIAQYTHSGSKPCNMAATGEYVMGISFEYRGNTNKDKGAPIDLVFPSEGLGWDVESFAIHKGTKNLEAAKVLADWASSDKAMALYGKNYALTSVPGTATKLAYVPENYAELLIDMDFDTAAKDRSRILSEWSNRYSKKSEPKS